MQGSAADLIKAAMERWLEWEGGASPPPARLLAQIHDELLFEVDMARCDVGAAKDAVRRVMEGTGLLGEVPILAKVKTGPSWGSLCEHA